MYLKVLKNVQISKNQDIFFKLEKQKLTSNDLVEDKTNSEIYNKM